jgi:AcrR family transcriptional regulator
VTAAADGRVRRGERSRQRILAALFDLIGAGVLQPTAQQVAVRAGVGMRTVFRHFSEMDSLYAAMDGRLAGEVRPALTAARRVGVLSERVAGLVRQRALLFERVAPYKRSANLQRWRSRFLEGRHRAMHRDLRADLLRWLPELRDAPAPVVEAVDLITSFEAWDRLRNDQGLGAKAASAVVERTVGTLLGGRAAGTRRAG